MEDLFQELGVRGTRLKTSSQPIAQKQAMHQCLKDAITKGAFGWMMMQSNLLLVVDGNIYEGSVIRPDSLEPVALPTDAWPVNGELCSSHGSLQWHWHGDHWHTTQMEETADGSPFWFDEICYLGDHCRQVPYTHYNLKYHRFWRDDDQGMRPVAARLVSLFPGQEAVQ